MRTLSLKWRLGSFSVGFFIWIVVNSPASSEDAGKAELNENIKSQVRNLSEALVAAKIEIDYLKARLETRACEAEDAAGVLPGGSATLREKNYLILDVNKELGMVILNGGHRDGVKPGLMFDVINGDDSVTTVRVVDSRWAIAGAVIQNMSRKLPKVQDRAVLAAGSKN